MPSPRVHQWWSALAALIVWWTYVALGLGLFADPENLPPLVRDFGPLTVPLVSALSLLALCSLVLASEAVRGADVARGSARVATVVSSSERSAWLPSSPLDSKTRWRRS